MKTKFSILLLLILFSVLLVPVPAYAIAEPDSLELRSDIRIFRHCLEMNDALIIVRYNIDYPIPPSEDASEAYLVRLMRGANLIGSNALYPFQNDGYDNGVAAIYWNSTDATDIITNWEDGTFFGVLEGNPALTWVPARLYIENSDISWHSSDSRGETAGLLKYWILLWARELDADWGALYTLTSRSGSLERLSPMGESYFTNVIIDLRLMAPGLFEGILTGPEFEREDYQYSTIGLATADGTTTQFTPNGAATNWECINEVQPLGLPADATFVRSAFAGAQTDLYDFADNLVPSNATDINVYVYMRSRASVAADLTAPLLFLAPNEDLGAYLDPGVAFSDRVTLMARPGGGTWTVADINALEFGLRSSAAGVNNIDCSQIYIYITYTAQGSYADELANVDDPDNIWSGTTYATSFENLANTMRISTGFLKAAFFMILLTVVLFFIVLAVGPKGPILLLMLPMLMMGNLWGFLPLQLTIIMGFLAILALGYAFFYRSTG